MQKVVNISLNGIAYQLEEPGYDQLRAYLERAESRLKDSPDRAEVMADLEQAIGEKCARVARARTRPWSTSAEVATIIEEMGPVESAEEKAARMPRAERRAPSAARRLRGPAAAQAPVQYPRRRDVGRRVQWHRRVHQRRRHLGAHRLRADHHLQLGRHVPGVHRAGVHRAHGGHRGGSRRRVRHALQHRRADRPRKKKL